MKKILIVDDKEENLYLLQSLLEASEFKVYAAKNGAEALGLIKINKPSLIITDILMPVMDGFTLCRECKKDESLKDIPIFFYTATYTDLKDEQYALGLGADKFILKPQEPDEFLKIVNDFLDDFDNNRITPKSIVETSEAGELREYNEVLIRKIEDKILQSAKAESELRQYSERLEKEIIERKKNEASLKESQLLFQTLAHVSPVGIFRTTEDGNTVYVNPKWCELSGLSFDEALGQGWLKAVHPDDRKMLLEKWSDDSKKGLESTAEYRFLRSDNKVVWVLGKAAPEIIDNIIKGYIGTITDITDQKFSEIRLKNSEERLKIIFENAPDAIYVMDLQGYFLDINKAAEKLSGFSKEEVLGKHFLDLNLLSDDQVNKASESIYKNSLGESTGPDIYQLNRKDGSKVFVEIISHPVIIEERTLILNIARNITERKKTEEALLYSQSQLNNALKIADMGAWEYDVTKDKFLFNDLFYSIFRTSVEEIGGYTMSAAEYARRFVHPDDAYMVSEVMKKSIESHDPEFFKQMEHRFIYPDGELGYINVRLIIIKDKNGKTIRSYGVNQNITKQKKIELELIRAKDKAEESDRLKTAFLHNISHEIRTPMNAIIGFTALLTEPEIDESTRNSFIETITQSSNQLLAIINDIIEISNIEAGVVKLTKTKLKLNSILKSLYNQFKPSAENKGLGLSFKLSLPEEKDIIETDRTKLIQIITNLISNAIKFTEKGKVEFGYKIVKKQLQFYVSDSGIGIQEDQFNRIFDRFYQVDHHLGRHFEGTGLGLSISKAFVEILGGQIWLESKPGEGSIFYFTLPHELLELVPQEIEKTETESLFKRQVTILIVEDNENNFRLLLSLFKHLNFNILQARNGKEAVEHCKSNEKIDLVLMDLLMPEMDGYESTTEIKKLRPDLKVIVQTAYVSEREKAFNSGCDDILFKPFKKKDIIDMIKKYIKE